jgi:HAD superfamily hydrolase (TIGR01549 family)
LSAPFAEIRWLFFDLGNTLVDEQAPTAARLRQIVARFEQHGRRSSIEDIQSALREAYAEFAPRLITRALEKLSDDPELRRSVLADTRYPKELEALYEGAEQALRSLAQHYWIGVIANQPAGTEARLTSWGLMPPISVCLSSAELGLEKPDPAIFRLALSRAGCAPHEAVMIGDRLDNDIRPARLQGWKTIPVLQGFAQFQLPRDEFDKPDATVAALRHLLSVLLPAFA